LGTILRFASQCPQRSVRALLQEARQNGVSGRSATYRVPVLGENDLEAQQGEYRGPSGRGAFGRVRSDSRQPDSLCALSRRKGGGTRQAHLRRRNAQWRPAGLARWSRSGHVRTG